MKKAIIAILVLLFPPLFAQEINLNQGYPTNKKVGRILKLEKMMSIGDEKSGCLLGGPMALRVDREGAIYVMEFNQLFKFSPKGKCLMNFCKIGQGPGEMGQLYNFILRDNRVILFGIRPTKVAVYKRDGEFVKELRIIKPMLSADLLHYQNDKCYIVHSSDMPVKDHAYFVDINHKLSELTFDGKNYKELISLPVQKYIMALGKGGWRAFNIGELSSELFGDNKLVISHTSAYSLKVFDIQKRSISHIFSRPYKRVDFKGGPWGKNPLAPKLDYEKDIKHIFPQEDSIWVVTSTLDEKKGALIDVFDGSGKYIDNFFLDVKGEILRITGKDVFVCETGKDLNPIILKYRIKKF